mmetsp:Transcript_1146/g.2085  ORF Transcript_1146/g.2085 Transcript_1146/m.2085 type:complete len:142 (-) Transcript_1146:12-437(-)
MSFENSSSCRDLQEVAYVCCSSGTEFANFSQPYAAEECHSLKQRVGTTVKAFFRRRRDAYLVLSPDAPRSTKSCMRTAKMKAKTTHFFESLFLWSSNEPVGLRADHMSLECLHNHETKQEVLSTAKSRSGFLLALTTVPRR